MKRPRSNDEQFAAAVTDSTAQPVGNIDCSTWEVPDGRAVENFTFMGQMKILPDLCVQKIFEHLGLGGFDKLRSSASSILEFTSLHEIRVLRRRLQCFSYAGQVTRYELRSIEDQEKLVWCLHYVNGLYDGGYVRNFLESLQDKLEECVLLWNAVLDS